MGTLQAYPGCKMPNNSDGSRGNNAIPHKGTRDAKHNNQITPDNHMRLSLEQQQDPTWTELKQPNEK